MLVASLQNVSAHFGSQIVLDGVSFQIDDSEKLGLIGRNGSGKTTLLNILTGSVEPTSGTVVVPSATTVGYVPQYIDAQDDVTVQGYLLSDYNRVSNELRRAEQGLESANEARTARALNVYQRARDAYDRMDGERFVDEARSMLASMGLEGKDTQQIGSLSGGEQNVLSLTKALLSKPDLLLLDEPGNHLDFLGMAWLEDFLLRFRGAVLVVSHNRYLLDRVAGGILELENGRVTRYEGNYSAYRAQRLRGLLSQQSDYIANQKRLAKLEALVHRFEQIARVNSDPAWGRRLRARRSQLEREKRQAVEKPEFDTSAIRTHFDSAPTRANIAVQVRSYTRGYGDELLFDDAEMEVNGGETVALVGANGTGKSTLLRDIVENGAWDAEHIRVGPSMKLGYSAQQQETLDDSQTVVQQLREVAPMSIQAAFVLLSALLFDRDDMDKMVGDLSGGERNRLQIARLMATKPNLLILDEPTNHMDIPSQEAVEEALDEFQGTLLVVSHDRYFLDKLAERVIEIRDRKMVSYPGGFSEFWQSRRPTDKRVVGRVSRRRRRSEPDRVQRAHDRQAQADLERRIQEAEARKLDLENEMAHAFANREMRQGRRSQRQLERLTSELQDLYDRWVESG
ncbi:MAG: ABC-F family ATP-binding cassette domain-containing protein [Dehalococcoidia bacterium]|nr:ABC-F family ATP-binding cassette domain-containing protein [Dehalococcoidia bacterium]